jgi:hypothetical protein
MSGKKRQRADGGGVVRDMGKLVRQCLGELPQEGGHLSGLPARRFLRTYSPPKYRDRLPDSGPLLLFRDGTVCLWDDPPPRREEEVIKALRPVDFARGEDGQVAFIWLGGREEAIAKHREAYRLGREKFAGLPQTFESELRVRGRG